MIFPETIHDEDMEVRIKEWELSGFRINWGIERDCFWLFACSPGGMWTASYGRQGLVWVRGYLSPGSRS